MPHRNVWIRKEVIEAWDSINNKSEWLYERLQKSPTAKRAQAPGPSDEPSAGRESVKPTTTPVDPQVAKEGGELLDRIATSPAVNRFKSGVCKIHGLPLTKYGQCLQKGCKYA